MIHIEPAPMLEDKEKWCVFKPLHLYILITYLVWLQFFFFWMSPVSGYLQVVIVHFSHFVSQGFLTSQRVRQKHPMC